MIDMEPKFIFCFPTFLDREGTVASPITLLGYRPNFLVLKVSHQNISKTESKDNLKWGKIQINPNLKEEQGAKYWDENHGKI